MDIKTYTIEGTAKTRRTEIRKAMKGNLALIAVYNEKGEITGKMKPVYVSHLTTIPPVVFGRDSRFRRPESPWRKRLPQRPSRTVITCNLVPEAKVEA